MTAVILVIHVLIAITLVGVVLLQRSEGGALGIGGGGGGGGGFMSGRGAANMLTRVTTVLAVGFFLTSIGLTILARQAAAPTSVLDSATQRPAAPSAPTSPGNNAVLPNLPGTPATPAPAAPAAPAAPSTPAAPAAPATPQVPQSQ